MGKIKGWRSTVPYFEWENLTAKQRVQVRVENSLTNKYEVVLFKPGLKKVLANYQTRNNAFKEASKYMRSHPNG